MGYYNPILSYGEERLLKDCREAGVNGFIVVDLPPEEAVTFRNWCAKGGWVMMHFLKKVHADLIFQRLSYVPLIAPATSETRMKLLCKLADSFIYVVSRMGVTGATGTMNTALPDLLKRVKEYSGNVPAAIGFGVSTRDHFLSVAKIADGVVIGSQIITTLAEAPAGQEAKAVEEYCAEVCGRRNVKNGDLTREVGIIETMHVAAEPDGKNVHVDGIVRETDGAGLADQLEALNTNGPVDPAAVPARFGEFGGQYVPESLMDCLSELEAGFDKIKDDPSFWEEYRTYYPWMGRPGQLHLAERLTEYAGGANIWLKREDLNHTGSHKINNALGQILLARRLGKTEIIAETGAGQHGVATATVCAKFGMKCTIYMGAVSICAWIDIPDADIRTGRCKKTSSQCLPDQASRCPSHRSRSRLPHAP
jgi:tryptophan synthase